MTRLTCLLFAVAASLAQAKRGEGSFKDGVAVNAKMECIAGMVMNECGHDCVKTCAVRGRSQVSTRVSHVCRILARQDPDPTCDEKCVRKCEW
jgi:hypothetical protein